MSWLYWTWANKTPFKIPGIGGLPSGSENQGVVLDLNQPREPGNVHEDRLEALARPYPQVVAGTPQEFSFDPKSKVFIMSYKVSAVSKRPLSGAALTEIFCPKRHFPEGYQVSVKGAKVVSKPGDRVLSLVNLPNASPVKVKVEARGQKTTMDKSGR